MHYIKDSLVKRFEQLLQRRRFKILEKEILALELSERTYEIKNILVDSYFFTGNYNLALNLLEEMEHEGRTDYMWYYRLGEAYYRSEQFEKAKQALMQSFELNTSFPDTVELLAWTFLEQNNMEQTEKYYELYENLEPSAKEYKPEAINHIPEHKKPSRMLAFFHPDEDMEAVYEYDIFIEKLKKSTSFRYKSTYDGTDMVPMFEVYFNNFVYEFEVYGDMMDWELFGKQSAGITDEVWEQIKNTENILCVSMYFSDDAKESYHLQMKILFCLFSSLIGVADYNTKKIWSAEEIKNMAISAFPPSVDYLGIKEIQRVGRGKFCCLRVN